MALPDVHKLHQANPPAPRHRYSSQRSCPRLPAPLPDRGLQTHSSHEFHHAIYVTSDAILPALSHPMHQKAHPAIRPWVRPLTHVPAQYVASGHQIIDLGNDGLSSPVAPAPANSSLFAESLPYWVVPCEVLPSDHKRHFQTLSYA